MYGFVLLLHSWVRWIVIVFGVGASLAVLNDRDLAERSRGSMWAMFFMMALDIQMLLGLGLQLVLSPVATSAMREVGSAAAGQGVRFWAYEHASMMIVAVALVHVGRVLARKASSPAARRTRLLISVGFATLLILVATPWPGLPNGRPLFRF